MAWTNLLKTWTKGWSIDFSRKNDMFAFMANDTFGLDSLDGEQFPGQREVIHREKRESAVLRRLEREERKAAAARRQALADAVELERIATRQTRRIETRAKNQKRAFRSKSILLRRQLRLERLLRLALQP